MTPRTVAILYLGEMGAALARVLRGRGLRVVTTLAGRGDGTAERCRVVGVEVFENLEAVVRAAHVVLSVVPPAAAQDVAQSYARLAQLAPAGAIFVDANSIRPELASSIATIVEARGVHFVDAAINGLAKNLLTGGTMYLSGAHVGVIAEMFGGVHAVRVLGERPGQASSMKMLLSGLSKGVCALFTELALVAERENSLPEFAEAAAAVYPEIWRLIERMLPTYARHATRRATEMRELEETAIGAGIQPCVIAAICDLHEQLAATPFVQGQAEPTVPALIRQLADRQLLSAEPAAAEMIHSVPLEGINHGQ